MTLTDFVDAIFEDLRCSCCTIEYMMESEDVDFEVDDVEFALADRHNMERCTGCDWWLDAGELADGYCRDCRSDGEDAEASWHLGEEKTDA